ncbi:MAG: STAS domain-containing protein [Gloeomargarita sp. SKYG116]|nr:STAS domain-containing protein [Gloeomargarita sp. SKYG116]MCS7293553.1 STAS domain-containing protein [Gloeomargarita sp. SKYB120]MDW8179119.1 STAS domain-containing protein [Gloeomargarita sp. SKYBB_i_bin120]MDW8401217.1 STAS domain-containing protein [Gloeomargarita sp. SKYGB_i_bin116]
MERILFTPMVRESFGQPPQPIDIPLTRLDTSTAETFKKQCLDCLGGQSKVVGINLSAVDFMDSRGLGALVSCSKQVQALGGQVFLVAPQPQILVLLETVALHRFIPIYLKREHFEQNLDPDRF